MLGSGGSAVSRSHREDRFYNPPAMRKHQQMMLQQQQQQQQQLQRAAKSDSAAQVRLAESAVLSESRDPVTALSQPPSFCSSSPPKPPPTNLDRFLDSVTPSVASRHFSEVKAREWRTREAELSPFFSLGDLWDSFSEWSVYGVGVPLLLNEEDTVKQYYVPFLSGIQLYVDPMKPRHLFRQSSEDSDAESSMDTSSNGGSSSLLDKRLKSSGDGLSNQLNLVRSSQQLNRESVTERSVTGSPSDEAENANSPGQLLFEYLELEQPHHRRPLVDKISVLASQFPELRNCRSCDLLPASWISIAWYPIYRIPVGPTLRDLDASFLTFHYLSTHPRCSGNSRILFNGVSDKKGLGFVDVNSKFSLPVFGLATYKLQGSILTPSGPHEGEKENSLLQAAENWLQKLQVILPDYKFFRAHYTQWK